MNRFFNLRILIHRPFVAPAQRPSPPTESVSQASLDNALHAMSVTVCRSAAIQLAEVISTNYYQGMSSAWWIDLNCELFTLFVRPSSCPTRSHILRNASFLFFHSPPLSSTLPLQVDLVQLSVSPHDYRSIHRRHSLTRHRIPRPARRRRQQGHHASIQPVSQHPTRAPPLFHHLPIVRLCAGGGEKVHFYRPTEPIIVTFGFDFHGRCPGDGFEFQFELEFKFASPTRTRKWWWWWSSSSPCSPSGADQEHVRCAVRNTHAPSSRSRSRSRSKAGPGPGTESGRLLAAAAAATTARRSFISGTGSHGLGVAVVEHAGPFRGPVGYDDGRRPHAVMRVRAPKIASFLAFNFVTLYVDPKVYRLHRTKRT